MGDDVCIANIGKKGRQQRMTFGLITGAIGLAIFGGLEAAGASRLWRLALLLPAMASGLGIFQATGST